MITFLLCAISALLATLVIITVNTFRQKPEDKGVKISISDNKGVQILNSHDGVHLDIIYDTYEDAPADYELFPDIVNDSVDPNAPGRDFWCDVADFDSLPTNRKEAVAAKLREMGFLRSDDEMARFVYNPAPEDYLKGKKVEDGSEEDPDNDDEPENSEAASESRVADTVAEQHPASSEEDNVSHEDFETFDI